MKKKSRGKNLESRIIRANIEYRTSGRAFILYKGTSVTITTQGAMLEKGPPDFEGLLAGGRYISFDAKECGSTTSFPFSGIREHQMEHLKLVNSLGGLGFFLVHFYNVDKDRAYKLPIDFLTPYWDIYKSGGKASISIKEFNPLWLVPIDNYLEL